MRVTPTIHEVLGLPTAFSTTVPTEYGDVNGHLNVRFHMALHDDGCSRALDELGFTTTRTTERRLGFFDLEHHLRYFEEVTLQSAVSVRLRFLDRGPKSLHFMSYLVAESGPTLASTLEVLAVNVDLETRRTVAFAPQDLAALDWRLTQDRELGWPPGTSGSMGIRR